VQTETRREFTAADHLKRAGYVIKVPRFKVKRNGDWKIEPLFPSYLFAQAEATSWSPIRWTIGVVRIVMDGAKPAELPEVEVEKIRQREDPHGFIPAPKWIAGRTRLVVVGGSFRDFEGIFQEERPRNRVKLLLTMLGADVPVELPMRDVEALRVA
jgi:transcription antitermination factor NusG